MAYILTVPTFGKDAKSTTMGPNKSQTCFTSVPHSSSFLSLRLFFFLLILFFFLALIFLLALILFFTFFPTEASFVNFFCLFGHVFWNVVCAFISHTFL